MSGNRDAAYLGPGRVEAQNIPHPKVQDPQSRQIDHGVALRVVSTNICGSNQHMVHGRTIASGGLVLSHEVTGEMVEIGRGVETMKVGNLISVSFNVVYGHCRICKEQCTGVCLTVSPARAGDAYGYVDIDGWTGGQAEYVLMPRVGLNLLGLLNHEAAMEKIRDLTCLSDILPTGYHGTITAGVGPDNTVYIAGAGPVGLATAASVRLLDAAAVIVGGVNPTHLTHAKEQGFETADLSKDTPLHEQIATLLGEPKVGCAVDAVGFETRDHDHSGLQQETPATVLDSLIGTTRVADEVGIPGLYITEDLGAMDVAVRRGALSIRFGLDWIKSHSSHTGRAPMMKYNHQLMQAIMWDRIKIADIVGVEVITLGDAPKGYGEFDAGVPKEFIIDSYSLFRAV